MQGNLDPGVLTGAEAVIEEQASGRYDEGMPGAGFVFNLGHGLFPEASLDKTRSALTDIRPRLFCRQR